MHLDDALKDLGEFGWYQRVHLLLVCGFAVLYAWHALNMVFLGAVPHFHCSLSDVNATWYGVNQSQLKDLLIPEGEGCKRYSVNSTLHRLTGVQMVNADVTNGTAAQEACPAGYVFSTDEYDSTITSEFKLVCTKKFLQSISKSVFFAGRLLGAAVFGQLSDRFGRRPMFFVGVAMMMLTGGVAAAAPNVFVFLSMYLLQGAAREQVCHGEQVCRKALESEDGKWRKVTISHAVLTQLWFYRWQMSARSACDALGRKRSLSASRPTASRFTTRTEEGVVRVGSLAIRAAFAVAFPTAQARAG